MTILICTNPKCGLCTPEIHFDPWDIDLSEEKCPECGSPVRELRGEEKKRVKEALCKQDDYHYRGEP